MSEINIIHHYINDFPEDYSRIPKRTGVYIITHSYDNIHSEKYVGLSKNLYNRMSGHLDKNILCVDLYITDSEELSKRLECVLLNLIIPASNIIIPPLQDKDKYLMIEVLENIEFKNLILNNISKIGCRYLKYVSGCNKRLKHVPKMKTLKISDELHKIITDKIEEVRNRYGLSFTIESIVDFSLRNEIPKFEFQKLLKRNE